MENKEYLEKLKFIYEEIDKSFSLEKILKRINDQDWGLSFKITERYDLIMNETTDDEGNYKETIIYGFYFGDSFFDLRILEQNVILSFLEIKNFY